jgi:hypothetical protein
MILFESGVGGPTSVKLHPHLSSRKPADDPKPELPYLRASYVVPKYFGRFSTKLSSGITPIVDTLLGFFPPMARLSESPTWRLSAKDSNIGMEFKTARHRYDRLLRKPVKSIENQPEFKFRI